MIMQRRRTSALRCSPRCWRWCWLSPKRYHHYEVASAAVQIAIVLASAAIITGIFGLVWFAIGLGLVGIGFSVIGFFFPTAVHLF